MLLAGFETVIPANDQQHTLLQSARRLGLAVQGTRVRIYLNVYNQQYVKKIEFKHRRRHSLLLHDNIYIAYLIFKTN